MKKQVNFITLFVILRNPKTLQYFKNPSQGGVENPKILGKIPRSGNAVQQPCATDCVSITLLRHTATSEVCKK